MPFARCSVHATRDAPKYAQVYSAWFRADGERTAYKQRLCPDALKEELWEVLRHAQEDSSDVTACPACGSDSSSDLDPIYLNVYLPKQEAREYQLPTCGVCAVSLRVLLQRGADKLPDRNGSQASSSGEAVEWLP